LATTRKTVSRAVAELTGYSMPAVTMTSNAGKVPP